MLSVISFAVSFSVAKYGLKSEYGLFVILFSIFEVVGNYQAALITTPLTVLLSKKTPEEKKSFLSGLGFGQVLFFTAAAGLALIGGVLYSAFSGGVVIQYIVVLSPAILAFLIREFIRTVNYSEFQISVLLKTDLLFAAIVVLGILASIVTSHVSALSAVLALGSGYLIAAFIGLWPDRAVYTMKWKAATAALSETWQYSRWGVIGTTSDLVKNQTYIYIVTAVLGLEKIAEISLARLMLKPLVLFISSSNKIILARGAEIVNKGNNRQAFKKFIFGISGFLLLLCIAYLFTLSLLYNSIVSLIGDKYGAISGFVILWGVLYLVQSVRYPMTNALCVCRDFKSLANYGIVSACVTVVLCFMLTKTMGGYGAILSLVVGETVLLAFILSRLSRSFKPVSSLP